MMDRRGTQSQKIRRARVASHWRFYGVAGVMALAAVAVLLRMAQNQVIAGEEGKDFLQAQGDARALREEPMHAMRGMITDRHGEPLAVSTPVITVWANPRILKKEERSLAVLAKHLQMSEAELRSKVSNDRYFVYLKRHMPPAQARAVLALDYAGVYGQRDFRRFYPAGEVTAHVVGFTDIDENGQEGMELAYNNTLKGHTGKKRVLKDLSGRVIKDVQLLDTPRPGENLRLSLDLRIQYLAYSELQKAIATNHAKSGSVVVLDARSGEVLAMANHPSYNPNNRQGLQGNELRNRAVTDVFEPGSTVKPLAMIAALESGQYKPTTVIDTHPGYVKVANKVFEDKHNLGKIDLTTIIAKSSQVGITKIAMTLEGNDIRNALYRMGFGQPTGSGFPGESIGVFPAMQKQWRPVEQATMAFGHGLSVTSLQLARAYAVLANGGERMPLSLVQQTPDTKLLRENVLAKKTARQLIDMMRSVAAEGGTATQANVLAYTVAGKTGTTHKAIAGGYAKDRYTSVFAGMAPANDPQFVTVVMVDEPGGKQYYGGQVAAPVFSEVMAAALRLYGVPPDNLVALKHDSQKRDSQQRNSKKVNG